MENENKTPIKPYLPSELAKLYGITHATFTRVWLKPFLNEIGTRNGNYYSVLQVEIIFKKLGTP